MVGSVLTRFQTAVCLHALSRQSVPPLPAEEVAAEQAEVQRCVSGLDD